MKEDKVYWLVNSEQGRPYEVSTWVRCIGVEKFVNLVEEKSEVVGVIFSGNNLGFVLKEEPKK